MDEQNLACWLSAVIGVDVDVLLGEIASPHHGRGISGFQIQMDLNVASAKNLFGLQFIEIDSSAILTNQKVTDSDFDPVRIEGYSGISGRTQDAPPVGVFSCHSSFHKG